MKILKFIEKYFVYIMILIILAIIFLIYITFFKYSYDDIENKMVKSAKDYVAKNNIVVADNLYIELTELGNIKGIEKCSQASGVIVANNNGKINYSPYLSCLDYQSNVLDNTNNYIELIGDNVVILNKDEAYSEQGYINKNNVVVKEESNFEETPGVYYIKYHIYDNNLYVSCIERIVIVSKNDKTLNMDGTLNEDYPKITLLGEKEINVNYGQAYNEPGYFASSLYDGDLTKHVIVKGEIDTKKVGEYYLTYSVTNSTGYLTSVKRKVVVIKNDVDFDISLTLSTEKPTKEVSINLAIIGEGYNYALLPNGEKTTERNISYKVSDNMKYTFKIYDKNDSEYVKSIVVNNIDKVAPTGSCVANFSNDQVIITVSAKDDQSMKEYKYYVDNKEFTTSNNNYIYKKRYYKSTITDVKVEISDDASNKSIISCSNTINITPVVYKDINGNECLEPYVCYKQMDYYDPYRASENGVGTIHNAGCQPTSMAIAYTKFNKRSLNGNLYNPSTLVNEVIYPDGKIVGYSNYERIRDVTAALNLKASEELYWNNNNIEAMKEHLRNENPVVVLVGKGCYTTGGHYMTIIGINEQEQVFLSDPYVYDDWSMTGQCRVNTWVSISEIFGKGNVKGFVFISE